VQPGFYPLSNPSLRVWKRPGLPGFSGTRVAFPNSDVSASRQVNRHGRLPPRCWIRHSNWDCVWQVYWLGPYIGSTVGSVIYQLSEYIKDNSENHRPRQDKNTELRMHCYSFHATHIDNSPMLLHCFGLLHSNALTNFHYRRSKR